MRTYIYVPVCFVGLLVLCLMFAPVRLVTGDRNVYSIPATIPSPSISGVGENRSFAELCRDDPVGALTMSLQKYRSDVEGYNCTLIKRERIRGKLRDREVIRCDFRESPFSVRMEWLDGRGRAAIMLYPAGDDVEKLAVVPSNEIARKIAPFVTRKLNDSAVREAARYAPNEFGMNYGVLRLHAAWQAAKEKGVLRTHYDGLKPIDELNGRPCHVLHRDCMNPEEEGLTEVTVFFDAESLLQTGVVLKAGDELIATYYFRDLVLNPKFGEGHFSVERLK
jgi:hypothetical protein